MKITVIDDDANALADTIAFAVAIRRRIDDAGYRLAVIEATRGEEKPYVVLIRDDDLTAGPPYTAVSVTDPPRLYHLDVSPTKSTTLGVDTDPDSDPIGCAVADTDTVADAVAYRVRDRVADAVAGLAWCTATQCTGLVRHQHGGACNWTCPCKPVRSVSTSNDPGARPGGRRSAQEPSEAPADHPGGSEARTEAPAGSERKPGPKPAPGRRAPGRWW